MGRNLLYRFEDYGLDTDRRELYRGTSLISLEPKVFDLLAYVVENRERVVSKEDLIAAIWHGRIVSESALTTCINAARTAIADSGEAQRLIKTLPRKGIRFVGVVREEGKSVAASADATPGPSRLSIPIADKPSIAVLPFTNMSGDPERDYFSDGITADIITELSRFRELLVIARNSSFLYRDKANDLGRIGRDLNVQYVVEGSIRTAGGRVRVTAGVVDVASRTQLWTEHYDRDMQDIFAVQDEVAQAIATTVEGRVAASGARRSRRKPTHDLAAYDYFLQARECLERYDMGAPDVAVPLLQRAIESDPEFARAYAWLSFATLMIYNTNLCPETLREGLMLARTAMSLDDSDAWSHRAIGFAYTLSRQFDLAGLHLGRAVELNPMDVRITSMRALWLSYVGRADDALRTLDADLRRDPFPPNWFWAMRGLALFQCRRYEEAIQEFSRVDIRLWHCLYLAAAHAHLGLIDQARAFVTQLLGFRADFRLGQVGVLETFRDPADLTPLVEGLRMAGLSE
jgi:adenylate cyclase